MTLNKEQIDHIRTFINARGFVHVEVEMEILDHVATAVEDLLEKDPEMSLDQAIQKVHRSFGAMGFSAFEDEVQSSLRKKMRRMYLGHLWQHVTSSKVLKVFTTAVLIFSLLTLWFNLFEPGLFKMAAFVTVALAGSLPTFYHHRVYKQWGKRSLMTGSLIWPFQFTTLAAAYLIQLMPVNFLVDQRIWLNVSFVAISLLVSATTWSVLALTKEVKTYAYDRWLKYTV